MWQLYTVDMFVKWNIQESCISSVQIVDVFFFNDTFITICAVRNID